MEATYYLVEVINGSEYNIYSGTEQECKDEMDELRTKYSNNNPMYISCNRYN